MKRILASFLILIMFAAPLVCGCGHEALATSSHQAHSADAGHGHDKAHADHCHKADVQISAQANVVRPDMKNSLPLDFAVADQSPVWMPVLASAATIRGPPFGVDPPDPSLPVFLTTRRLRL